MLAKKFPSASLPTKSFIALLLSENWEKNHLKRPLWFIYIERSDDFCLHGGHTLLVGCRSAVMRMEMDDAEDLEKHMRFTTLYDLRHFLCDITLRARSHGSYGSDLGFYYASPEWPV